MPFNGRVERIWWSLSRLRMEMAMPLSVTAIARMDLRLNVSPSSAQAEMAAITGASVMNNCPKRAPITR